MEISKINNLSVFSKKPNDNTTVSEDEDKKTSLFKSNKTTDASLNTDDNESIQALNEAENEIQTQSVKDSRFTKTKNDPAKIIQDVEVKKQVEPGYEDVYEFEMNHIINAFKENKSRYENLSKAIEEEIGVKFPPELICAIHYREASNNFDCYLQNGDPLGKPTEREPKGLLYYTFEESAKAAILNHYDYFKNSICPVYGLESDFSTMSSCLGFAECYNSMWYRDNGEASPYVYSCTTEYAGNSLYTSDHHHENVTDHRPGVAIIMQELIKNN